MNSFHWIDNNLRPFWLLVPSMVVPILVAHFLFRGTWKEIFQAYGIWIFLWFLIGLLLGLSTGSRSGFDEVFAGAFILGLFLPAFGIPILVLMLKLRTYFKSGPRGNQ